MIPGYIASDPEGIQTTLGRNGSDFSGSIFGALLDAAEIIIWTDVDGVLSAYQAAANLPQGELKEVVDNIQGIRDGSAAFIYQGNKVTQIHQDLLWQGINQQHDAGIASAKAGKPTAVICHTVKGKGIPFAENDPKWHHQSRVAAATINVIAQAFKTPPVSAWSPF